MPTEKMVTIASLHGFPMFAQLSLDQLQSVAQLAKMRTVARHEFVVTRGEPIDNVYLVLAGSLKVTVSDEEGREVILSMLGPGEIFGEVGVIDENPRSASVVALENSNVIVIAQEDFKRCMRENFDIALYVMRKLAQRLRSADQKIESLALMDVYGRVARQLLDMATATNGEMVIKQKVSKQDMAKMIGASREMVSRVMKDLHTRGFIEEGAGKMILHEHIGHF